MQLCSPAGQAQMQAAASVEALCNLIYGEDGNHPDSGIPVITTLRACPGIPEILEGELILSAKNSQMNSVCSI